MDVLLGHVLDVADSRTQSRFGELLAGDTDKVRVHCAGEKLGLLLIMKMGFKEGSNQRSVRARVGAKSVGLDPELLWATLVLRCRQPVPDDAIFLQPPGILVNDFEMVLLGCGSSVEGYLHEVKLKPGRLLLHRVDHDLVKRCQVAAFGLDIVVDAKQSVLRCLLNNRVLSSDRGLIIRHDIPSHSLETSILDVVHLKSFLTKVLVRFVQQLRNVRRGVGGSQNVRLCVFFLHTKVRS
mmetsp:Transcript_24478/g.56631  ORF Transcript_24478/g.56631 Transcript_24478/m.56631 type:complete len:238 (+) Transcript_24478:2214-2927(+)